MDDSEQPAATKSANPRISQACQRCRSLKTRCLPSPQEGVCQRCASAKRDCVWADTPRRARKLRAPSRISQVEQKIDSLVAGLIVPLTDSTINNIRSTLSTPSTSVAGLCPPTGDDARERTQQTHRPVAPGSWLPFPSSFEQISQPLLRNDDESDAEGDTEDRQYIERIRTIHSFGDSDEISRAPEGLFQPSKRPEAPIKSELVQNLIALHEADAMLNDYRDMSASFPFVIVHPTISAEQLHTEKPMLFLAILTVASWKDHQRQMTLDALFRKELAHRTMIAPRRTLGLVQSVLVYLSWYHFVFSHKTQQIFFLHHLVIGLALDIGLHQDYQPLNFPHHPKPAPPSPRDRRERHRAFLGCYYLASMVAAALQKPNLLKYTSHMGDWAQELQRDGEYESDETVSLLIALRHIDDQVQDTLYFGDAVNQPLTDARTIMHVRFMESQLEGWQRNRSKIGSQRLLDLSASFTDMLLHNVALRQQPDGTQPPANDSTQLNGLLAALEAGKRFLDAMLSFPVHEYHLISFSEWMRLPNVIMAVARLCMPTEAHTASGWDVKTAQDRVRLDLCLESLCYRMQQLTTYDKVKQTHPDFWYAMRFIIDLTKSWYCRKIAGKQKSQAKQNSNLGQDSSGASIAGSGTESTPASDPTSLDPYAQPGAGMGTGNLNPSASDDPFEFLKDIDFDMEQFLDMGIWGDETYSSLGFGNGMPS